MDHDHRVICLYLMIFLFFTLSVHAQIASEDSIYLPQPRSNPQIDYSPLEIQVNTSFFIPADNENIGRKHDRSISSSPAKYQYVKDIFLPKGTALIGKIEISATNDACITDDSLGIAVQILEANHSDYETVAQGFLHNGETLTLTLPGRYTPFLKILYESALTQQDPIAEIKVYEILLSAANRIMLLGDSITEGKFAEDGLGYRKELYHLLLQKGLSIDFVGSYGEAPYEGHFQGGRKVWDFLPISQGGSGRLDVTWDMDTFRPNVVAIHLGTNDINDGYLPTETLGRLVNYLLQWHNGTRGTELKHIFVSLIIPIKNKDSMMVQSTLQTAQLLRNFQQGIITGKQEPVHIVDHFTRFYEDPELFASYYKSHMADNLHPNTYGHHVMALTSAEAIAPVLSGQILWFSERTWETNTAGIDEQFGEQGVAIADANSDNLEDIYVSRTAKNNITVRDLYLQNQPNGVFHEKAEALNIQDSGDSRGVLFADVDNDGDVDLLNGNSPGRNRLYDNLQNVQFQDITTSSGLENINALTTALLVFDGDGDGDLDFYAVNSRTVNEFYLNNGVGRFSRVDRGANDVEEPDIPSVAATTADFDGDGDIDIYIVKRFAANKLFINNGKGYFTEGAATAGLDFNHKSNSACWADLDNDGDLDLVVSVSNTASDPNPILRIFKNNGNGTFQNISSNINIPMDGYSPLLGDFDNDGDIDIVTTNESRRGEFYRNNGNWSFSKINNSGAEIFAGDVRGAAVFDYDDDGDLDFYAVRNDVFNVFKRNNLSNGNHYLRVLARGPNQSAIGFGTKIWLYTSGQLGISEALLGYREVISGTGHTSQYSPIQHFGLGTRNTYDLLAQFSDGTFLAYRNGAADQTLIIEPKKPTPGGGGMPAELVVFSGNGQVDTVGQQLPLPIVARVVDAQGQPVANVRVDFSLVQGQASLILPTPPANDAIWLEAELGRLSGSMRWAYDASCSNEGFVFPSPLHRAVGYDTINVMVHQAANYTAWARVCNAGASGVLYYSMDGNSKQAIPITTLNTWQWLKLTPPEGLPLASGSHKLTLESSLYSLQIDKLLFTSDANYIPTGVGDGSNSDPLFSDRDGLVRRYLQLGTQAGTVVVQARMEINGQTKTALFQATAKAGPAVSMVAAGGNNQTGLPGVPLSQPFVVALKDAYQNPTPGVPVLFSVQSGGGTLTPIDGRVSTDASGLAQATLTPGRSSSLQKVIAEAAGVVGSPVVFQATVPGIASRIQYLDGNQQSDTVTAVLSKPIKFKITADNGDPVAGYLVTIKASEGGQIGVNPAVIRDSLLQVLSGQDGSAQIYWRLGPRAGVQTLKIEAPGLTGSPVMITATAAATEPYRLYAIDGDGQVDTVKTVLKKPFTVRVTDRYGNPRSGLSVLFKVIRGNGSFNGALQYSSTTDALGDAKASFTLGSEAGTNIYEVQASCHYNGKPLVGSPLSFWASAHAGKPRFIFIVSGDQQSGVVGTLLQKPLVVAVRDFYQNIVVGGRVRFSVTRGNGLLYGESSRWVMTDSSGQAAVFFQIGTQAGNYLHEVTAELEVAGGEFVRFSASAVADKPHRLVYFSGNNQAAVANTPLKEPLCVVVLDRYQNPIFNHPVLFEVLSPSGSFAGSRMRDVYSDQDGKASVVLTLGEAVGDSAYVVRASAKDAYQGQPLVGSPVLFYASGLNNYPVGLWAITLPSQTLIGTAGRELTDTIRVRVVDEAGHGVPAISVRFEVIKGGGKILPHGTSSAMLLSGADGIAAARWQLGTNGQIHQLQVSAHYNGQPLNNSPILYSAIAVPSQAHEIKMLSQDNPIGTVGQPLPQSIMVQVVDDLGIAVAGYPVQIQVKRGGGSLEATNDTLLLKYSDSSGLVTTGWKLGPRAGDTTQVLEIISRDGQGHHLLGSPRLVRAKALPAAPALSRSLLAATSPVAANGADSSHIQATIRDQYDNPIANLPVLWVYSGVAATVVPLQGQTDAQGLFRAIARSSQAGELTIKLQHATNSIDLTVPATIRFLSREASRLQIVSGDGQSAKVASYLPDPLFIKVVDVFGDPVADAQVRFLFHKGNGEIAPVNGQPTMPPTSLIVKSDEMGLAGARVKLGIQSGIVIIKASLVSYPEEQQFFTFSALPEEPSRLSCLAGDRQIGTAGHRLGQPLTVQLLDLYYNPIFNMPIEFSSPQNGYFSPAAIVSTDSSGIARVFWYLGPQAGEQRAQAVFGDLQYSFSATALENQPPVLTLPDSVEIFENQPWTLFISLYDAENDSMTLLAEYLPSGASLGADRRLRWTPSYDQAGRYEVMLIAQDRLGAKRIQKLVIIVHNVNRPPQIDLANSQPPAGNVIVLQKPASLEFRVVATDADGDSLNYVWYVNEVLRAVGSAKYRLNTEWMPLSNVSVKVVVSDRQDTTSLAWRLQITTSVMLTEFTTCADPYQGIVLRWRTASERDLLGFYVLRAEKEGLYVPISKLIVPARDGQYQFVDANIQAGVVYYYSLQSVNSDGSTQQHLSLQGMLPLPTQVELDSAYPNPFNAYTVISCSLPQPMPLQVRIYDLLGHQVKELCRVERAQAGYHRFVWDGRDETGVAVASGIYYCAIKAGEERQRCKLVLIR